MIGELRDYFAMSALQGLLSSESVMGAVTIACVNDKKVFANKISELSFNLADAMLAARVVKKSD